MVILSETQSFGTVIVPVPFIQGAEVTFSQDISVAGMRKIQEFAKKKPEDLTDEESKIFSDILAREIVKDWNFAELIDGVETKLPITSEIIDNKMSKRLRTWLQEQILSFFATGEAKKDSKGN